MLTQTEGKALLGANGIAEALLCQAYVLFITASAILMTITNMVGIIMLNGK